MLIHISGAQPSIGEQVSKGAWTALKFSTQAAEKLVEGTPFNILLPAVNKMFEVVDVSYLCYNEKPIQLTHFISANH